MLTSIRQNTTKQSTKQNQLFLQFQYTKFLLFLPRNYSLICSSNFPFPFGCILDQPVNHSTRIFRQSCCIIGQTTKSSHHALTRILQLLHHYSMFNNQYSKILFNWSPPPPPLAQHISLSLSFLIEPLGSVAVSEQTVWPGTVA